MKIPHTLPTLSSPLELIKKINFQKIVVHALMPICGWALLGSIVTLCIMVVIITKGRILLFFGGLMIILLGAGHWIRKRNL